LDDAIVSKPDDHQKPVITFPFFHSDLDSPFTIMLTGSGAPIQPDETIQEDNIPDYPGSQNCVIAGNLHKVSRRKLTIQTIGLQYIFIHDILQNKPPADIYKRGMILGIPQKE
jgi:hypothetical protein